VGEAAFGAKAPAKADLVRSGHHADRGSSDHRQVREVGQRGSQRDHLLDARGPALRKDLRQQSAAAVSDQGHRGGILFLDLGHAMAQPGQHVLGVEHVEVDSGKMRAVSHPIKPAVKQAHRPIAG
jgi:hypothetical protein